MHHWTRHCGELGEHIKNGRATYRWAGPCRRGVAQEFGVQLAGPYGYPGIMADTRVGISGWRYASWRGKFYPPKLPQNRELNFAAHCVNSVEINGSFYSLQRPNAYSQWYDNTPSDFLFSVKGSRFITHMKQLKNIEEAQANFWASGVLRLEEKLGPVLWQLPPFALR